MHTLTVVCEAMKKKGWALGITSMISLCCEVMGTCVVVYLRSGVTQEGFHEAVVQCSCSEGRLDGSVQLWK